MCDGLFWSLVYWTQIAYYMKLRQQAGDNMNTVTGHEVWLTTPVSSSYARWRQHNRQEHEVLEDIHLIISQTSKLPELTNTPGDTYSTDYNIAYFWFLKIKYILRSFYIHVFLSWIQQSQYNLVQFIHIWTEMLKLVSLGFINAWTVNCTAFVNSAF
jgi:hypothetical protein